MVIKVLRKIFGKSEILQEYIGELKIVFQNDSLTISNFNKIYSIDKSEVILEEIIVLGEELRVVYQDKIKIIGTPRLINKRRYKYD